VARRFTQPDVARNHRGEDAILKELADVARHLLPQVRPLVVHRHQHAGDVERRVERAAHAPQRRHEIGEAFEREVLAVERNQHGVRGDERIQREESEGWGRVDEDEIEAVAQRRQHVAQTPLAIRHRDELHLGAGEIAIGRHQRQPLDGSFEDERRGILGRLGPRERLVHGARLGCAPLEAESAREVPLRVHVDGQDLLLRHRERRREVDRGGRLADAAFLICDRECPTHLVIRPNMFGCSDVPRGTLPTTLASTIRLLWLAGTRGYLPT